jgi:hypothetical protein
MAHAVISPTPFDFPGNSKHEASTVDLPRKPTNMYSPTLFTSYGAHQHRYAGHRRIKISLPTGQILEASQR